MAQKNVIYGLIDPRNGELRYVGKSVCLVARLRNHLKDARAGNKRHVYCWLRQLLAAGLKPEVEVLEEHAAPETLYDAEQWYIAYWRSIGADLTNHTDGGRGPLGFKHTAETKKKLSLIFTGKPSPKKGLAAAPETCARLSLALSRYMSSMEARVRASRANSGRAIVDQNGAVYDTKMLAERILHIPHQNITKALQGKIAHAGGYTFRYVE